MTSSEVPKVAILDDYLNSSKPHFANIPEIKCSITTFTDSLPPYNHPNTSLAEKEALVNRLKPFTVLCTMRERTPFPKALLEQLPNLKLLIVTGTQFNTFDMSVAKEHGIIVAAATKGRSDRPKEMTSKRKAAGAVHTVQHTWALILALVRNVSQDDHAMKQGGWQIGMATGLAGKTLGILGLGRLGSSTAKVGFQSWGMKIICWSLTLNQEKADQMASKLGLPLRDEDGDHTFKYVSKEELFKNADVVSVHYQLSDRSKGIVGKKELEQMKKSAYLVNTSRGPLIDEDSLIEALEKATIKGAALDVYEIEPVPKNSPFRSSKWGTNGHAKLLTTPHMGYVEEEIINNWYAEQAEILERWLDNKEVMSRLF
jgi:lactate dehydrogenase-like 2-hydroxyacid dehydrogenase